MTPRELVTRRIATRAANFPAFDLAPLQTGDLSSRDAALARAIDHAVARRWLTLAAVLDSQLDQAWDQLQATVQAPLLVGAAQLLLMEKLPDHAVINEAVEWTKHNARRKAGGLVNAVLRKVAALRGEITAPIALADSLPHSMLPLDDGRMLRLTQEVFSEDPAQRLAEQTSHSLALVDYWNKTHGRDAARRLCLHSLVHPPIIVTGIDADAAPLDLLAHSEADFYVYTGPREQLDSLLARHPHARVQDPGTAKAMTLSVDKAAGTEPSVIIDLCAGRGTKTRQLAQLHPNARIVATDLDSERHSVLRTTFQNDKQVEVVAFADVHALREQADLLVLDVPCSNTGVLARRVEAKYRFSAASLQAVRDLQRQIVADAIPLLSPRGRLLYSTCSIEPTENEQQIQWIEQWHPLRAVAQRQQMPRGLPGEPLTGYCDGGFAALMGRTG